MNPGRAVYKILRFSGLPYLIRRTIQKRRVTILLFHDLAPGPADEIFDYLRRAYNLIDLETFREALERQDGGLLPSRAMVITFDDGLKRNYDLLPVLRKYRIPVTVFLCAGIVGTKRHFWFFQPSVTNDPGRFRGLSNTGKLRALIRDGFRLDRDMGSAQSLSREEIEKMRLYVDFQAHGMFHRNIITCNDEELNEEILGAKRALEADFGLTITAFAFPSGDYEDRIVDRVRAAGYGCALTNDPFFNTLGSDPFRLKRLPALADDSAGSLDEVVVRASGLWDFFKILVRKRVFPKRRF